MILNSIKNVLKKQVLPNFLIIGAQKSGTSSLFTYLSQHPQLSPPCNKKEVHYFDGGLNPKEDDYDKGEDWYRSHFPFKKELCKDQQIFEASPLYIFNPDVAERIYKLLPNIKLIAVLRNPTERAISQYFHEKRLNTEPLPILEAFQKEEQRLQHTDETKDFKSFNFIHFTYKSRGLYHIQLERYFKYFSRDQILILNSQDLFDRPEETLKQTFEFIGVDSKFRPKDLVPRNVSENRVRVDSKIYDYLDDYFSPHNQVLYDLLGIDFNW